MSKHKRAFAQIAHTNKYEDKSPEWDSVGKNLPPEAFAVVGDKEDPKTWLYPHHYVLAGQKPTNEGYPTQGELVIHHDKFMEQSKQATADGNKIAIAHFDAHFKAVDPDRDGSFLPVRVGVANYSQRQMMVSRHAFDVPAASFDAVAGAEDGSCAVTLVALSGEILDRPEWGACVQDLAGMKHADRIVLDYKHNDDELLGFIDRFDISTGKLILQGKMIPQRTHQRVEEIMFNQKAGLPYEASIYFPPSTPEDMEIEFVEAGETASVNGRDVVAPEDGLTIFRQWVLRGVACCPHGADRQTAAYLQGADASDKIAVSIKQIKETGMTKEEQAKLDAEAKAKQKASDKAKQAADEDAKEDKGDEMGEGEECKEPDGDEGKQESYTVEDVKKFGKAFGARAHEYMGKGLSFSKALEADHKMLSDAMAAQEAKEAEGDESDDEEMKQSAPGKKPAKAGKFAQSAPAADPMIDGIPAKFAQDIHDGAMKYGWSEEKVKLMIGVAKKEYARQEALKNAVVGQ